VKWDVVGAPVYFFDLMVLVPNRTVALRSPAFALRLIGNASVVPELAQETFELATITGGVHGSVYSVLHLFGGAAAPDARLAVMANTADTAASKIRTLRIRSP